MSYLWNVLTSFTSFFNKNSLKKYTEDDYNKILFSETNSKEEVNLNFLQIKYKIYCS